MGVLGKALTSRWQPSPGENPPFFLQQRGAGLQRGWHLRGVTWRGHRPPSLPSSSRRWAHLVLESLLRPLPQVPEPLSPGLLGTEDEPVCPGGHGLPCGPGPGREPQWLSPAPHARLPQETLAFREELDVLKFLCKDLWVAVFQKQMDSLRANHQGTYVLQDNSFPLLIRMASGLQYLEEAPKFLAFTCGLLRGTLSTLGIKSLVTASVASLPTCKFQVVIQKT
ncbi:trafficking protein particle complex subunit 6A isoform X1 [Suricata suricatta]|uniref:trafficking protein particle complex subunit 6A isoform X1 n=1 Tax=Suricata suricatta TaxID=37032 RepID=UPI001155B92B|nr:trafficking protein particle complex subunit 6A isoform X1 [Suricata suricatta]